jgi:tetratricopeptide (TPR) repeat protein
MIMAIIIIIFTSAGYQRNELWSTKFFLLLDNAGKSPGKSRVHLNLGNCYGILGKYDEAVAEFEKACALDKANLEVYPSFYNIGLAYELEGYTDRAIYCYELFCKNAPSLFVRQKEQVYRRIKMLSQAPSEYSKPSRAKARLAN